MTAKLPLMTKIEKYHIDNLYAITLEHWRLGEDSDIEKYYLSIQTKTERINRVAVSRAGELIQFIDNPSYKVQLIAIKNSSLAIKYIKHPVHNIYHWVAHNRPNYITTLPTVPDWAYKQAITKHIRVMGIIQNPSYDVQNHFIKWYYEYKKIRSECGMNDREGEHPLKYFNTSDISPDVTDLIDFYEM